MTNYCILRPKIKNFISLSNVIPSKSTVVDLFNSPKNLKVLPEIYVQNFGKVSGDGAIGKVYAYYYYNNMIKGNDNYWPFVFQKLNLGFSNRSLASSKK